MRKTELLLALALVATPAAADPAVTSNAGVIDVAVRGSAPKRRVKLAPPKGELKMRLAVVLEAGGGKLPLRFEMVAKPSARRAWTVVARAMNIEPPIGIRGSFRSTDTGRFYDFHFTRPEDPPGADPKFHDGAWNALEAMEQTLQGLGEILPDADVGAGAVWSSTVAVTKHEGAQGATMESRPRWELLTAGDRELDLKVAAPMRVIVPPGTPVDLSGRLDGRVVIDPALALPAVVKTETVLEGSVDGRPGSMRMQVELFVER
jgi:hypothetical protein